MRYEVATEPVGESSPAITSSHTDELMVVRLQLATAQQELDTARTAAERSANEFQQRLAELTQENARLIGEVHGANEALESLCAESHAESTQQQTALTERLSGLSQENAALIARHGELQAKIAQLEEAAAQVNHLETELAATQAALQPISEELAKLRKSHKLDAIAEELARALESAPADHSGKLEPFQTVLAEAREEWVKVSDLQAQIEQLVLENHHLRKAMAKAQEEAVRAKCCLAGQTNEQFDQIRRAFVAKRNEKPDKPRRFWPFRTAWHPL